MARLTLCRNWTMVFRTARARSSFHSSRLSSPSAELKGGNSSSFVLYSTKCSWKCYTVRIQKYSSSMPSYNCAGDAVLYQGGSGLRLSREREGMSVFNQRIPPPPCRPSSKGRQTGGACSFFQVASFLVCQVEDQCTAHTTSFACTLQVKKMILYATKEAVRYLQDGIEWVSYPLHRLASPKQFFYKWNVLRVRQSIEVAVIALSVFWC